MDEQENNFQRRLREYSDSAFVVKEVRHLLLVGAAPLAGTLVICIIAKFIHIEESLFLHILSLYLFLSITFSMAIIIQRITSIWLFLRDLKK